MAEQRQTGQLKFFDKDRGFGFIVSLDDKKEYFVHFTAIKPTTQCWNVLYKGEYVEFSVTDGNKGPQAIDVTGVKGGSLLCEHEFEYRRRRYQKKKQGKDDNEGQVESFAQDQVATEE